jgi:hypothetical protein
MHLKAKILKPVLKGLFFVYSQWFFFNYYQDNLGAIWYLTKYKK